MSGLKLTVVVVLAVIVLAWLYFGLTGAFLAGPLYFVAPLRRRLLGPNAAERAAEAEAARRIATQGSPAGLFAGVLPQVRR